MTRWVLVAEDERQLGEMICDNLQQAGHHAELVGSGDLALARVQQGGIDLLILDVMLPDSDGFELLKTLREKGVDTPAIFLTARSTVTDRIRGLNLGADDYLVKPFAFAELLARISAVARRTLAEPGDGKLACSDLELDLRRHAVTRGGEPIELTPKEFALLEYMMRNQGQAISRAMITEKVWGYGFDTYSNLIDVHINHLRKKVDRGFANKLIHTVKGVGYVLEDRGDAG